MIKTPHPLKKGDTIGITCPASYMTMEKAQTCIDTLQGWGYGVMVGKTLGSDSTNYFSGADDVRTDEFQAMLDDSSINAILFGRGGYGMSRIIDGLDFTRFKKNPKWLIGFSDITVLHCHIYTNLKIATLHGPMAAAFNDGGVNEPSVLSLKAALAGKMANYKVDTHAFNQAGEASGELVGGNLSLLVHTCGTPSDIDTRKKILFIEDTGEYIYSTDRMLHQLLRSGKLDKLAGLVVGGFAEVKDTDRPFGQTVYEVIHNLVKDKPYPVCFNFPVSHGKENYALTVGGTYTLKVGKKGVWLKQE